MESDLNIPNRDYRPEQIVELAELARGGDAHAANELTIAVWPWVRRIARLYARKFSVDTEDMESAGLSRMAYAIRAFDRTRSRNFLTYFAPIAVREMIKQGRREADRRARFEQANADEGQTSAVDAAEARPEITGEFIAWAAYRSLHPRARLIVRRIHGIGTTPRSFHSVAQHLGMPEDWVRQMYRRAIRRLRAATAERGPN
jgi:RNA polymerase sigma factor (sigma-70 family)